LHREEALERVKGSGRRQTAPVQLLPEDLKVVGEPQIRGFDTQKRGELCGQSRGDVSPTSLKEGDRLLGNTGMTGEKALVVDAGPEPELF
jgi:hypothetical protein